MWKYILALILGFLVGYILGRDRRKMSDIFKIGGISVVIVLLDPNLLLSVILFLLGLIAGYKVENVLRPSPTISPEFSD
jgi:hypothetical protein